MIIKYSNVYATTDYHEIFLQNAEISKIEKDGVEPLFIFEILEITFTKGILKEFRDISTTKNVFTYLSNVMTSCAFSACAQQNQKGPESPPPGCTFFMRIPPPGMYLSRHYTVLKKI